MQIVDMHIHSSLSDGYYAPDDLWNVIQDSAGELAQSGLDLRVVSLTDHDTLLGLDRMVELSRNGSPEFLPGVELDCHFRGCTVHVMVYFPSRGPHTRTRIKEVLLPVIEAISRRMDDRISRVMVGRVNTCKDIRFAPRKRFTTETVRNIMDQEDAQYDTDLKTFRAAKWSLVGRLMMEYGYVDTLDEMRAHLKPGGCCKCDDVEVQLPYDVGTLLQKLSGQGFTLILAHPSDIVKSYAGKWLEGDFERGMNEVLAAMERWQTMGLDGVECYSSHSEKDCPIEDFGQRLLRFCKERRLLISGGSDFHGGGKKEKIGTGFGSLRIPFDCVKDWYKP